MAHNINFNSKTGEHSFFSVKEIPWHGLGTILQDYPTSAEAIQYAGLDFEVEKRPLFTLDTKMVEADNHNGLFLPSINVPDYYATVRTDTDEVLDVVGSDYHVVQNVHAFDFFDSIVGGKNGIMYETAGALGKGERIFITAKLPGYIRIGKDDLIDQYLFLTTAHDGTGSITAAFTPIRIVCNNTLNAALQTTEKAVRIRHTANAQDKLKEAHKLLGISHTLGQELKEIFNQWTKVRITDANVKRLVQLALAPNKEVLEKIYSGREESLSLQFNKKVDATLNYAFSDPTQTDPNTMGTLYGCYNAVTDAPVLDVQ
ncbi:DUF945 domain-containing protein [Olivibacter sp. SDN3]|uniref:DUF932 domain-containing protein n=1 Tax=Olivibacter sp. SDN3 TaxID=2764720 RepID=UPI0016518CFB|nr:DUF932 domain-containing protein [Olivibacter sp. SDN3]QNL49729.1 DUF945 domain-containing protein [Olivibacter sp. SDN3]